MKRAAVGLVVAIVLVSCAFAVAETVEDATAEESAEFSLDEARDGALAFLRAGQEGLEPLLDHAVEDGLLGAAPRVASRLAAPSRGMRTRVRGNARVHAGRSVPAPYPLPKGARRRERACGGSRVSS